MIALILLLASVILGLSAYTAHEDYHDRWSVVFAIASAGSFALYIGLIQS